MRILYGSQQFVRIESSQKRFHADAVQDGVTNKARQIGHFAGDNRR